MFVFQKTDLVQNDNKQVRDKTWSRQDMFMTRPARNKACSRQDKLATRRTPQQDKLTTSRDLSRRRVRRGRRQHLRMRLAALLFFATVQARDSTNTRQFKLANSRRYKPFAWFYVTFIECLLSIVNQLWCTFECNSHKSNGNIVETRTAVCWKVLNKYRSGIPNMCVERLFSYGDVFHIVEVFDVWGYGCYLSF